MAQAGGANLWSSPSGRSFLSADLSADLLILDNLGLHRLTGQESADLYELIVSRRRVSSFVITSNRAEELIILPGRWPSGGHEAAPDRERKAPMTGVPADVDVARYAPVPHQVLRYPGGDIGHFQFLEARPGPLRNSAPRALPAGPPFPTLRTTPSRRTPIPRLRSRAYRKDKRDLQGSDRGDQRDQQDQREARLFQVHPAPLLRGPRSLVTTPPVERARDPGITTARTPPAARRAVFRGPDLNGYISCQKGAENGPWGERRAASRPPRLTQAHLPCAGGPPACPGCPSGSCASGRLVQPESRPSPSPASATGSSEAAAPLAAMGGVGLHDAERRRARREPVLAPQGLLHETVVISCPDRSQGR